MWVLIFFLNTFSRLRERGLLLLSADFERGFFELELDLDTDFFRCRLLSVLLLRDLLRVLLLLLFFKLGG